MPDDQSKTTTDHDTIRQWAEARGGVPVSVAQTDRGGGPGVLRIDFPDRGDEEDFDRISWDAFFEAFEENDLAFLYQEETKGGEESRFCKLVNRD